MCHLTFLIQIDSANYLCLLILDIRVEFNSYSTNSMEKMTYSLCF